jgi:hypothetical protein
MPQDADDDPMSTELTPLQCLCMPHAPLVVLDSCLCVIHPATTHVAPMHRIALPELRGLEVRELFPHHIE